MLKLNTAALDVPTFVTVAELPAAPVVVVPAAMVAAVPFVPFVPAAPCGMVKSSTAAVEEPELLTDAEVPAAPVVVEPTATLTTVAPVAPCGPEEASETDCVIGVTTTVPLASTMVTVCVVLTTVTLIE
jgi:hypothetical protein